MALSPASQLNRNSGVCGGCGSLCDDIQLSDALSLFEQRVEESPNLCCLGKRWFQSSSKLATCLVDGRETDLETAISNAIELIRGSRMTIMGGLEGLSTTAQQFAWRLADQNRMVVDSGLGYSGRGESLAVQQIGHVTATLGEIAERSDLSLYWFCNPAISHPRHLDRFERKERERITVDSELSETGRISSQFIDLKRQHANAAINVLQGLLADLKMDAVRVQRMTGHAIEHWQQLLKKILSSKYSVIYTHPSSHLEANESDFDSEAEGMARLVRQLNLKTRVVAIALRNDENAIGAENVLAWSSGFPFAINLNRGFPRFFGKEFSFESVLDRKECDLIFLASTAKLNRVWDRWSESAKTHFLSTKKIVLSSIQHSLGGTVAVEIPVSRCGVSCGGDFCRQDNVSIGMPILNPGSVRITPEQVMELLSNRIQRK